MADEENFLDQDVTGDAQAETGERRGFLSAALINILKWVAIGLAAVILVATVSYITFSLFIRGREPQGLADFSVESKVPQIDLEFFSINLDTIRGQTADDPPASFLASLSLGYKAGDTTLQTELVAKNEIIQNRILIFLGQKTARELSTRNLPALQEEIKNMLNGSVMSSGLIYQVLFSEVQTF